MKKIQIFQAITVFLILIFVSSCKTSSDVVSNGLIQKRKYTKGYYVKSNKQTKSKKEKRIVSKSIEEQVVANIPAIQPDVRTEVVRIETSKRDNTSKQKRKSLNDERIAITLKDILGESKNVTSKKLTKINQKIARKFSQQDPLIHNYTPANRKLEPLGLVSFFSALIGLFFAGILFGTAAVVLSIISLNKFSKNPGMYKGKGWAIIGLILGIGAIVGAILVLAGVI